MKQGLGTLAACERRQRQNKDGANQPRQKQAFTAKKQRETTRSHHDARYEAKDRLGADERTCRDRS
ncbi:MAG: hypothetical protein JWN04_718 [Myxococcaceae bacterium]|nr:hypothetical protein [Myxococcaceae bacterium]